MVIVLATLLWLGCDKDAKKAGDEKSGRSMLIISGDTGPWLVPCGCTANQSGGLLRRATLLETQRRSAPVIYADVGGAAAGTTPYFREKFRAVLRGEVDMGIVAHNLGQSELALGPDALRSIAKETGIPFISCNTKTKPNGAPLADAMKIVSMNGKRVALVGVVSSRYVTDAIAVDAPAAAITATLTAGKGTFDSVVILAYVPDAELQELATTFPEADAVVGGPTGQAQKPSHVGPVLVGSATNKGKFLIRLTAPTDAATTWTGDVLEVESSIQNHPHQQANLDAYLSRLGDLDIHSDESGMVPRRTDYPDGYRIAGSESCLKCHEADHATWVHSAHSHAGETLKKNGFHVDPYCLQCHTTGFALPGGFVSAKTTPELVGVGCESCHGPSQAHVERASNRTTFDAFDQCVRCHDHENSPMFNRDAYWQKIKHGKREPAAVSAGGGVK